MAQSPRPRRALADLPQRATLGTVAGLALAGALAWPATALPAPEDWSIERRDDDKTLTAARFRKLRARPFDAAQWKALRKALGPRTFYRRIESMAAQSPGDVSVQILLARAQLAKGDAGAAAQTLGPLAARETRYRRRVIDLHVGALIEAGRPADAIAILRRAAKADGTTSALARAHQVATRAGLTALALELAQELADALPADSSARLRLAEAASAAAQPKLADDNYEQALALAPRKQRQSIQIARAKARAAGGNPTGASELYWAILREPNQGSRALREQWFDDLVAAHRRANTLDLLIPKLRTATTGPLRKEGAAARALASALEATGADATSAWEQAAAVDPKDPKARTALVTGLAARGDMDAAIARYQQSAGKSDADFQLGLDLANRLMAAGQRERAIALARSIEARAKRRPYVLLALLDFYNLGDSPDAALAVARSLVRARPRDPQARIALGEQLYQMNRVREAMTEWESLSRLYRPQHRGLSKHAELLSEHGRAYEAIETLKAALRLAPEQPAYHRLMAVLKEEQGRPDVALGHWQEVRRLATTQKTSVLRDEARTRIVELLVSNSRLENRGRRLHIELTRAQRILDAGEPLDDALESGRLLAELHTRREHYPAAVSTYEQMRELAPNDASVLSELATAQRRAGMAAQAILSLETLLELAPSRRAEILADLSELSFAAGDQDRALAAALRAVRADPNQVSALLRLGELHERHGDLSQAAEAYTQARAVAPTDGRAQLRLAELALTQGQVQQSATMFRELLERGGPPELMRLAGRRALDLAEATSSAPALLELAVRRTGADPNADEPREFLLETLERTPSDEVEAFLLAGAKTRSAPRAMALRQPLVASLSRGPISLRLRAAAHLGHLRLPDTAAALANMAASLVAPRDATRTVQNAFDRARVTALLAAGNLQETKAIGVFAQMLEDPRRSVATRRAAAWALARTGDNEAVEHLTRHIRESDRAIASVACIAVAIHRELPAAAGARAAVGALSRSTDDAHLAHACRLAEAALTPQRDVDRLIAQLDARDPVVAGIAAWRLGVSERPTPEIVQALLVGVLRPPGLARDAAAAALWRLLSAANPSQADVQDPLPPLTDNVGWPTTMTRWLHSRIASPHPPVPAAALRPYPAALSGAMATLAVGTRAERQALEAARCSDGQTPALCLEPIIAGRVPIPE